MRPLEFDKGYIRRVYGTDDLYGGMGPFEDSAISGQRFHGLSIDPGSHYRALQCYFDDEADPVYLVSGQLLRRGFQRVRVAPMVDWTNFNGTCDNLPAASDTAPQLFTQQLVLDYWHRCPDASCLSVADPGVVQIPTQSLRLGATAAGSSIHFLGAYVPGARKLLFWAHNEATSNAVVVRASLWALSPERNTADVRSSLQIAQQVGSTLFIPAGTATTSPQQLWIFDPAPSEFLVLIDFAAAGSGTVKVSAGVTAYFGGNRR